MHMCSHTFHRGNYSCHFLYMNCWLTKVLHVTYSTSGRYVQPVVHAAHTTLAQWDDFKHFIVTIPHTSLISDVRR